MRLSRTDVQKMWDLIVGYLDLRAYGRRGDIEVVEGGRVMVVDGQKWEVRITARKVR